MKYILKGRDIQAVSQFSKIHNIVLSTNTTNWEQFLFQIITIL